jgi:ATP-dependent Clp protease ATP-binding subunit ClpX
MEGADLHFTRDAIAAIAEKAIELKTGARALRSIMERIMLDVMYELPQTENVERVVINRSVVEGRSKPKLHFCKASKVNEAKEDKEDSSQVESRNSSEDAA